MGAMNTLRNIPQRIRREWHMAGSYGRASMVAAPLLLLLLLATLAGQLRTPALATARPPRPATLPSATATPAPAQPWEVATGDGQGPQAAASFTVTPACDAQRLTYRAGLSELGQSDVWIGFAIVDGDGQTVEMTPSRDVLAHPTGSFTFALSPGDYRLRVQGRGAEWQFVVECIPGVK